MGEPARRVQRPAVRPRHGAAGQGGRPAAAARPALQRLWADPQKQATPQAWADQDLPALARAVRGYTRDVLDRLRAQGTPADMLQLGNEIRSGMLWPSSFLSDLLSILASVPDHHGAGVFYWEPEWVPGVGWAPGEGTPNDNLTLFDFQGRALPSVGFADPLRHS